MPKNKGIQRLTRTPYDFGKHATDIDSDLPWNNIPETDDNRKCNFSCLFYDDPPNCELTNKPITLDASCVVSKIKYQQAFASKERR